MMQKPTDERMKFRKAGGRGNGDRKMLLQKFDRSKLPAHRFLKWLMENEISKKYLVVVEAILVAGSGLCVYLYYFA